jgi:hypothetical protein
MPIDYERAKREGPKLKAALTRAAKTPDVAQRFERVKKACKQAVYAWEQWGAWPDNWRVWESALVDASNAYTRETGVYVNTPLLSRLEGLL